jgi:hydroxyacylglutathione hydrolase
MLHIHPIPAFQDNYVWALFNDRHAVLVDPGDAGPCVRFLESEDLTLSALLITHHHADHTGGIATLAERYRPRIIGPANETIAHCTERVSDNSHVAIPELDLSFEVISTPGHTLGHVAYYGTNRLFCGDTLFACGCGRLFEGTAAMMHASLQRLARLPDETEIFCAHEYTLSNIAFAKSVDGSNAALLARESAETAKRRRGQPTLPATLALEKATNPFLRCDDAALARAAERHLKRRPQDAVEIFATLRKMKDEFH